MVYSLRHEHAAPSLSIIIHQHFFLSLRENDMGNSLHNKIHLGRASVLSSKPLQAALAVAGFASIGMLWMLIRT